MGIVGATIQARALAQQRTGPPLTTLPQPSDIAVVSSRGIASTRHGTQPGNLAAPDDPRYDRQ
jgi:hypothetical protein